MAIATVTVGRAVLMGCVFAKLNTGEVPVSRLTVSLLHEIGFIPSVAHSSSSCPTTSSALTGVKVTTALAMGAARMESVSVPLDMTMAPRVMSVSVKYITVLVEVECIHEMSSIRCTMQCG